MFDYFTYWMSDAFRLVGRCIMSCYLEPNINCTQHCNMGNCQFNSCYRPVMEGCYPNYPYWIYDCMSQWNDLNHSGDE